jgi:trigger factor
LVQSQARVLAQDVAQNLKQQGFNDAMIQEALSHELPSISKRAENQVRASLILESIAKKEKIEVTADDVTSEIKKMAENMKADFDRVKEFYDKNENRKDDLEFRMREDRTVEFLLGKAKIKNEK